ncbi:MAG TPA: helix-turn-helix domain-containing protein [Glycomyces sp.]
MPAETRSRRSDALRNRDRLLAAAADLFAERGLEVPLDEIARTAGVSIGTLYNHFPTRDDLYNAIIPARLAALDQIVARALEADDPWDGFVAYLEGVFGLQAQDRSLNDAIARRRPASDEIAEVCARNVDGVLELIARAKASGDLREDFQPMDLAMLGAAISQIIHESGDWRRFLDLHLTGLRRKRP